MENNNSIKDFDIKFLLTGEESWATRYRSFTTMMVMKKLMAPIDANDRSKGFSINNDMNAEFAILCNVAEPIKEMLDNCTDSKSMWAELIRLYSGINPARKLRCIKNLASFNISSGVGMAENFTIIEKLVRDIKTASGSNTIDIDEFAVAMFLNSLPDSYAPARVVVENDPENLKRLDKIKIKIIGEECSQKNRVGSSYSKGFSGVAAIKCNKHNFYNKELCWKCNTNLHPSNQTCKDCKLTGHKSSNSAKCKLNKVARPSVTPSGSGFSATPKVRFQTDSDWGNEKCIGQSFAAIDN